MLSGLKQSVKRRLYPDILAEGETAPQFHLHASDGSWYELDDQLWTVLVFYPADDTPGCTSQLSEFQTHLAEFSELGCRVIGVNPEPRPQHRAFADKAGLTFPLLEDHSMEMIRQYACSYKVLGMERVVRTVYLINPQRKIRFANRGAPPVEAVLRSIRALQQAAPGGM